LVLILRVERRCVILVDKTGSVVDAPHHGVTDNIDLAGITAKWSHTSIREDNIPTALSCPSENGVLTRVQPWKASDTPTRSDAGVRF
jgi:hypothetical protein